MAPRLTALVTLALVVGASDLLAQPRRPDPLPTGNRITAQDGDTLVIEDDARIRVVRRREADVRIVFNPTERWVLVLADFVGRGGPDGRVDWQWEYRSIAGEWPWQHRTQGRAAIEEYSMAVEGGPRGMGLRTSLGLVQFLTTSIASAFDEPGASVISFMGAGAGIVTSASFDEAEQRQIARLRENIARDAQSGGTTMTTTSGTMSGGFVTSSGLSGGVTATLSQTPGGPVRVGGNIRQPRKIVDVPPVLPELAAKANVRGVVILEIVIDTDGSVKDIHVLRSIPLLDQAAIDAARQWKYEPTALNGVSVPVIMTVPVNF